MPETALLNDINEHAINFYSWLRRGLKITVPVANDAVVYYQHRERFNAVIARGAHDTREAAELFYYLNRTGYNGLCRFNRQGQFNVPFGRYKRITYATDFLDYVPLLRDWYFTHGDFEAVSLAVDDFVYADPPYDVEFTSYAKEGFGWDDQVRLAKWLAGHPGPVVLSNQATPRVVELYDRLGFQLLFFNAPRMISCTGDRTPAREVLALKGLRWR